MDRTTSGSSDRGGGERGDRGHITRDGSTNSISSGFNNSGTISNKGDRGEGMLSSNVAKEQKASKRKKEKKSKKGKKTHSGTSLNRSGRNDDDNNSTAADGHHNYDKFKSSSMDDYHYGGGDSNMEGGGSSSRARDRERTGSAKKGSKKRKLKEKAKAEAAALAQSDKEEGIYSRRPSSSATSPNSNQYNNSVSGGGAFSGSSNRKHKKSKSSQLQHQNSSSMLDSHSPMITSSGYTPEQANVNDMMRRALEEDQYSALGSVVDTDSSDDENILLAGGSGGGGGQNHANGAFPSSSRLPPSSSGNNSSSNVSGRRQQQQQQLLERALDRSVLLNANRKRLRAIRGGNSTMMSMDYSSKSSRRDNNSNIDFGGDSMARQNHPNGAYNMGDDADSNTAGGSSSGGRKKKRKKGKLNNSGTSSKQQQLEADQHSNAHGTIPSDNDDHRHHENSNNNPNAIMDMVDNNNLNKQQHILTTEEVDIDIDDEDSSLYGQTTGGSINSTWVQCDRCQKWRRLRGVQDGKKLPTKWYCSMNKNDPDRANCNAQEEDYGTPESATDQRARKHLRLWVRRLQCNEAYEARLPPNMTTRGSKSRSRTASSNSNGSSYAREPYEWVRCCNPSCGKWRAILKFMDANTVIDNCKDGEWYCVLNTWDEKFASCAAPQENLPAIGCPSWVMQDEE